MPALDSTMWKPDDDFGLQHRPMNRPLDLLLCFTAAAIFTMAALSSLSAGEARQVAGRHPEPGRGPPLTITVRLDDTGPRVSPYLTGFNVSYFSDLDSVWADGRIPGYLKQVGAGVLRYPGGEETSRYHWERPGARGYLDVWDKEGFSNREKGWKWSQKDRTVNDPSHMDTLEYLTWCRRIGAEPMLGVNVSSGIKFDRLEDSLDEIRRWYQHCREYGHKVRFWYVDNEPWHHGTYQHMDVKTYADAVIKVSETLKEFDPGVKIICNPVSADHWGRLKAFLRLCGSHIDIIDFHWYWNWGRASFENWLSDTPMTTSNQWRRSTRTYTDEIRRFRGLVDDLGHPHIELASHEWNIGPCEQGGPVSGYMHCLMTAEMMFQFAEGGLHSACMWPLQWVWDRERILQEIKKGTLEHSRFHNRSIVSQIPPHDPLPSLESFTLFRQMLGGQVIQTDGAPADLPRLAVRKQQRLLVYLLNKVQTQRTIRIEIPGMTDDAAEVRADILCTDDIESNRCTVVTRPCGNEENTATVQLPAYSLSLVTIVGR